MLSLMLKPVRGLLKNCFEMKKPPPVLPEGRLLPSGWLSFHKGELEGAFFYPLAFFKRQ